MAELSQIKMAALICRGSIKFTRAKGLYFFTLAVLGQPLVKNLTHTYTNNSLNKINENVINQLCTYLFSNLTYNHKQLIKIILCG